jgi:hypothetical protein
VLADIAFSEALSITRFRNNRLLKTNLINKHQRGFVVKEDSAAETVDPDLMQLSDL